MLTALSLFVPYLLGLGFFASLASPRFTDEIPRSGHDAARHLAIVLLCGVSLNYLLVLVFQGLAVSLEVGLALSVAGFAGAVYRVRRCFCAIFRLGWPRWLALGYLVLLFALPILLDPIREWDARSIWFFHGKIIFHTHGLDLAQAARETFVSFAHLDYPKLVPVLAAQFAHLAGYWNEFFPKASILVILIPAILGIFSFSDGKRLSFLCLVFCLFPFGKVMWDGYLDSYLALYVALSLLYGGRWLTGRSPCDLLAGALFLAVAASLKNEGVLCAVAGVAGLSVVALVGRRSKELVRALAGGWRYLPVLAVPLGDLVLWGWRKGGWGVENDLQLGVSSFPLIRERIASGGIRVIDSYFLHSGYVGRGLIVAGCALVISLVVGTRPAPAVWLAAAFAGVYTAGMTVVYLATNRDLQWHLENSADRTMSTVVITLFVATYFLLRGMEGGPERLPETGWPADAIRQPGGEG